MNRAAFFACLFTLACTSSSDKEDTGATAEDTSNESTDETSVETTIDATVRVLNAMTGAGMENVSVENTAGDTETTNSSGQATLSVTADSTFEMLLQKEGAIDHLLFGPTGSEDFDYVTFMATEALVETVLSMLGATPDDGTGVVIVGIDYDNLSPAVGASAALNVAHDDPWVLGSMGASYGDTIPENGMGMVAFSNVQPGEVSVSVTPPEGKECTAFPGGGSMPAAPVAADLVTVVTFHCR
jgi:hypothetical protein